VGRYAIAYSLRNADNNFMWAFGGVYGPNDDGERSVLCDEMAGVMSWWDMPWCFGGDFNVVRFPNGRSGATRFSAAMEEFLEVSLLGPIIISGLKLIDFYYLRSGKNITQRCHNEDCLESYLIIFLYYWIVGHKEKGTDILNLKMWLKSNGFVEQVQHCWETYEFYGRRSYVLANKLKALKVDLKKWNAELFGDVGKKEELLEGI
jgi:hypothetical protein